MRRFNDEREPVDMAGANGGVHTLDVGQGSADGESSERSDEHKVIGIDEVRKARQVLERYKSGRAATDLRIIENQNWWRLKNRNGMRAVSAGNPTDVHPNSAWLFNALCNKHADAMDNYPSPNVLGRSADDEQTAKVLSEVLPCILDECRFKSVYNEVWWDKLISGTGIYGIFWNAEKNNVGDVDICAIDPLMLYSDPAVKDIQRSRNVFTVERFDRDELTERYPQLKDKEIGGSFTENRYDNDDNGRDDSETATVIDWYYKRGGVLHYCKFVGDEILFSSENSGEYPNGYYAHGSYPFVIDTMYPIKDSPYGFGTVDIGKDTQQYIDKLEQVIYKNAISNARPRYFVRQDGSVNENEFADTGNELVHCQGNVGEDSIRPIEGSQLGGIYLSVLQEKINELKETTSNRDVSSGSAGAGVTSGSAIAALQEAGNKTSRDMIKATYDRFEDICYLVIEVIREFYTTDRTFRIVGDVDGGAYATLTPEMLQGVPQATMGVDVGARVPVFDIRVVAQKSSTFSREMQNQRAQELYGMGFFAPQNAEPALACLDMMDFEGKDKVKENIAKNSQMLAMLQQLTARFESLAGAPDGVGDGMPMPTVPGAVPEQAGGNAGRINTSAADKMRERVRGGTEPGR